MAAGENKWLTDVIASVGPGGNYLCERSTVDSIRSDEWYISDFGSHETFESWKANGKKDFLAETREEVNTILESHQPLPLGDDVEKELENICSRAREIES